MILGSYAFHSIGGVALALLLSTACSKTGGVPSQSPDPESSEPSIESLFEEPAPELSDEISMSERLLPKCLTEKSPPRFPTSSEGAVFRAVVHLVIGHDGKAEQLCYRRVEGGLDFEEKAMSDRDDWKFDPKFSGQKREKFIVYRKNSTSR